MSYPTVVVGLPITKIEYLKEAILSLNNQSYSDFELIVLNNGENEEIRAHIRSIVSENYSRTNLRYFENKSQLPIVENWNKCLSYAEGEFFILFSDDDLYHPDFIKEMIALSNKYNECNLFHCRIFSIDEYGNKTVLSPLCPEHEEALDFIWHRIKGYRHHCAPDFMCRTKNLKDIGGFQNLPLAWGSDDITWFLIAKNGGVAYTQKTLCSWRYSRVNLSNIGNIPLRLSSVRMYISFVNSYLKELEPKNIEEVFLLKDIKEYIHIWGNKAQVELFRIYFKNKSFFKTFFLAFRYKLKNELSFKTFSKILLYSTVGLFKS